MMFLMNLFDESQNTRAANLASRHGGAQHLATYARLGASSSYFRAGAEHNLDERDLL